MVRACRNWLAFLLVLAGAACAGAERDLPTATVRDSAGVRIVEISGQDAARTQVPVHVADLAPPDEVLPATPWGVAVNPAAGRVYVADRFSHRVVVFDASGTYVGVLGRSGAGPGEFVSPQALHMDTHGVLWVWDAGRGVISRWSAEGEFLDEEKPALEYWGPGFAADSTRLITVTGVPSEKGMGLDQQLVISRDGQRSILYELPLPMHMMDLPCVQRPGPVVLAPTLNWASRGDSTYVHHYPDYRVDVFRDTTLVASIRRAVPPIEVTEDMAAEAVEYGPTPYRSLLRTCNVTPVQVVHAVGYEEHASPIMALAVDNEGGLWVTRTEDGINPSSVDVFDPDGNFRATLTVPAAVVGVPSSSSFLTLRMDRETGQVMLSIYSLDGAAPATEAGKAATPAPAEATSKSGVNTAKADWTAPPPDDELEPGDEFQDCPECPTMVVVPAGHFLLGSPEGEAVSELSEKWQHLLLNEKPQVDVEIGYTVAVGKYEITFDEWESCRDAGGCDYKPDDEGFGRKNRPVLNVNVLQAAEYLAWLSNMSGREYRLPTDAEWEYAARAGTTTARDWGDAIGDGNAACRGCGGRWNGYSTAPVGSFAPNPFGLYDMLGNAAEWVSDCYTPNHEGAPTDGSPVMEESQYWESEKCTVLLRRGGAWLDQPWVLRSATRRPINTKGPWGLAGDEVAGFRVFVTLKSADPGASDALPDSTGEGGGSR